MMAEAMVLLRVGGWIGKGPIIVTDEHWNPDKLPKNLPEGIDQMNRLVYYDRVGIACEEPPMNIEIGAFEAKTKLPELLRGVMEGKRYTITNRGKPVAELVPISEKPRMTHEEARLRMIRYAEEACRTGPYLTQAEKKALKEEGRM